MKRGVPRSHHYPFSGGKSKLRNGTKKEGKKKKKGKGESQRDPSSVCHGPQLSSTITSTSLENSRKEGERKKRGEKGRRRGG